MKGLFAPYKGLRKEIYVIFISRTINAMGAFVFPFLTLLLTKKIGMSESEAGFYTAMSGAIYVVASLIGGKIVDKFGRKKIIIISETLGILCYGSCFMLEPSMLMAYLLILSGVFFGLGGPAHDAMIADLTTPDQRDGAYSLNYLGFNFGYAIAQLFAGFLFEHHLKLLFIIDAVTALMGVLLIGLFVKETMQEAIKKEDIEDENNLEKKESGSIIGVLLKRPILIMFAVAIFGYKFMYSQWSFTLPMHAVENFGEGGGAKLYGLLGTVNAVIVVLCTPILTAIFKKYSNIKRVLYAGITFIIGFGLLGFISTYTAFFACVVIFTLGEILEATSVMPFIMNHTPASHRGRMGAVLPLIMGAGFTVGPLIIGPVIETRGFSNAWHLSTIIVGLSVIAMVFIHKFEKKSRVKDEESLDIKKSA